MFNNNSSIATTTNNVNCFIGSAEVKCSLIYSQASNKQFALHSIPLNTSLFKHYYTLGFSGCVFFLTLYSLSTLAPCYFKYVFCSFCHQKKTAAAPLAKLYSKCLYAKYFVRQKGLRII